MLLQYDQYLNDHNEMKTMCSLFIESQVLLLTMLIHSVTIVSRIAIEIPRIIVRQLGRD